MRLCHRHWSSMAWSRGKLRARGRRGLPFFLSLKSSCKSLVILALILFHEFRLQHLNHFFFSINNHHRFWFVTGTIMIPIQIFTCLIKFTYISHELLPTDLTIAISVHGIKRCLQLLDLLNTRFRWRRTSFLPRRCWRRPHCLHQSVSDISFSTLSLFIFCFHVSRGSCCDQF